MVPPFEIEHVGYVTDDQAKFERFWCDIMGYSKVRAGSLTVELCRELFGLDDTARTVRYANSGGGPDIEIHVFAAGAVYRSVAMFYRFGLNHIAIKVADKVQWAHSLPKDIQQKWYDNPGGWKNLFIRDYEGNWIEVRD